MAVGVKLGEDAVPDYSYYSDDYYYLESTTEDAPVGHIPSQYTSKSELEIYEISFRPYLIHNWINNVFLIYTGSELGDIIQLDAIVENDGRDTAENIIVKGLFTTVYDIPLNTQSITISSLEPGKKKRGSEDMAGSFYSLTTAPMKSNTIHMAPRIDERGRKLENGPALQFHTFFYPFYCHFNGCLPWKNIFCFRLFQNLAKFRISSFCSSLRRSAFA